MSVVVDDVAEEMAEELMVNAELASDKPANLLAVLQDVVEEDETSTRYRLTVVWDSVGEMTKLEDPLQLVNDVPR